MGVQDGLFFMIVVSVATGVFAVLFTTSFAFVALSAVGCESVFEQVVALAAGKPHTGAVLPKTAVAGEGDLSVRNQTPPEFIV